MKPVKVIIPINDIGASFSLIGAGSLLGAHFLLVEIQAGAPNNGRVYGM